MEKGLGLGEWKRHECYLIGVYGFQFAAQDYGPWLMSDRK